MPDDVEKAVDMVKQLLADDETKEKLSSVLGNVMGSGGDLGGLLKLGGLDNSSSAEIPVQETEQKQSPVLSPELLQGILPKNDDKRVSLLKALKPYLSDKRNSKVENAITVMRLAGLSSSMGLGKLFKQ